MRTRVESLIADIAAETAKSTELGSRMTAAARDAQAALVASNEHASKLEQDLAGARASLQAVTQSNAANEQAKTKLAEFQSKLLSAQSDVNEGVRAAIERVMGAESALLNAPSKAAYEDLGKKQGALKTACERARKAVESLEQFAEQNKTELADSQSTVNEALNRCVKSKASLGTFLDNIERCMASRRESSFDVLANEAWQPSDLTLSEKEVVAITAAGKRVYGHYVAKAPSVGPEGENGDLRYRVVDRLNNGALVLRIRGSEFAHPGWMSLRPERAGKVEFRINDTVVNDNSGSMQVTMWAFLPVTP